MKMFIRNTVTTFVLVLFISLVSGNAFAEAFKSPSFGGTTGLVSTPTANTGWEDAKIGLDVGYHYINNDNDDSSHIPKVTLQLFNIWELGVAFDLQDRAAQDENDMILHTKINFYNAGSSALAIGGNLQFIDMGRDDGEPNGGYADHGTYGQLYMAVTYSGNFFSMPAETTLVVGKTFGDNYDNSNIDFSMGFDLNLLPQYLKGYVHWINDFANYSYSVDAMGSNNWYRGCFNTGIRLAILKTSRYKFNIDVIMTDALDTNRGFALGTAFGLAF